MFIFQLFKAFLLIVFAVSVLVVVIAFPILFFIGGMISLFFFLTAPR